MPTFRVTYRCVPGSRWLVEDVEADRHDLRSSWHVFARVMCVVGVPRWVCALRVHDRDVSAVTPAEDCGSAPDVQGIRAERGGATLSHRPD